MEWPFTDLPMFSYGAIMADPAWDFKAWSRRGEHRSAKQHYDCMTEEEIKALPVGHLASRHCALFLWVPSPLLPLGLEVMAAWGFKFKTLAFCWAKPTKQSALSPAGDVSIDRNWRMTTGYWTRQNTESCLLGTTGQPKRLAADVRQLIVAPLREHSRKPDQVYDRIVRLVGGPYCELFSRQRRPGWDTWGNELDKFQEAAE